ncbi:MAG: hypothetical protein ACKVXR_02620 [Planctomycetota bacterium]
MSREPASPAPALTPQDWERFLSERLDQRVVVSYGRSRTTPLQARRPRKVLAAAAWQVRMHSMFAAAPVEVRSAVVDLLGGASKRKRGSGSILDAWITRTLEGLPRPRIPDEKLETRGVHHDLARIAESLLESELRGEFDSRRSAPRITWGRPRGRRPVRGLRLGSYDVEIDLVRIHPSLDQPAVPDWFVRYVLFHEFLHALHPPVRGRDGRWIRHGRELVRREKTYPDLARALAWERDHIDRLIRSARTKRPMRTTRFSAKSAVRLLQGLLFPAD